MHLGVPLLLVRPGELPPANVAGERLFTSVRPDVRRQVVGAAEGAHADPALEGFLPSVYPNVAGQLVRSGETPIAVLHWACVWALVDGRLAWPVGIFAGFDRN